jgi:hypothetical protein
MLNVSNHVLRNRRAGRRTICADSYGQRSVHVLFHQSELGWTEWQPPAKRHGGVLMGCVRVGEWLCLLLSDDVWRRGRTRVFVRQKLQRDA